MRKKNIIMALRRSRPGVALNFPLPAMSRKLFCEISPFCYQLSVWKNRMRRYAGDMLSSARFASRSGVAPEGILPVVITKHQSPIRRKLGKVDAVLQENKAVNLALAAARVNGVLIRPGETFSFWHLVGMTSARLGYLPGLIIRHGKPDQGVGGGLCQMSNLIHWLVLHSPLDIVEHHHHDKLDLFPDCDRKVPFGMGTSISHNYVDYRFRNNTRQNFQLLLWCDDDYLCGELRAEQELPETYQIQCDDEYFAQENGLWFRHNKVCRTRTNRQTGALTGEPELLKVNHARVMYDIALVEQHKIRNAP